MIAWLNDFFADSSSFMPHGACYLWLPSVLWMHVVADSIVAVAYYSIPFALFYFVKKRTDLAYRWVFVLFAVFILLCGTTHILSIWTIWRPDYWLEGLIKLATAFASIVTAIIIWPLIPKLLQLPSSQALQDSEAYLRALFNAAPDAMLISNQQGIITMANQQAECLLGYPIEELLGLPIETLMPESVRSLHPSRRAEFAASGHSRMMGSGRSIKTLCKNGSELDVEISLSPIKTTQGLFFASSLRDVSDRIKMQQALENKSRMLTESQQLGHIGSWALDLLTGEVSWTDEMYNIYGISPDNFERSTGEFLGLIHSEDRKAMEEWISQCLAGNKPPELDFRIIQKTDGSTRFIRANGDLQYDSQGKPVRMVGSAQDITVQKQAEKVLRMLNAMIEIAMEGFWIVDRQGKILQVNGAYAKMTGYSVNELLNMHVSDLSAIDNPEQVKARMEKIISLRVCDRFESQHRHKNGYLIDVEVVVAFLAEFQQFCAFFRDISERKRYEEEIKRLSESELNKAKLEAERASKAKSDFLSSMSHELRTPMNAVLGFAQLLIYEDLTEEQYDSVQEILTAGHHLLDLINEVLDLSKIESESLDLKLEEVDLNLLLQNCINLAQPLTLKNKIQIINNISKSGNFCIFADTMRFKQVLLNLMSNAIKYNRVNGSVTLSCEVISPKTLRVNITDTGNGLSDEQIAKLFQPFERLSAKNSSIEGTGIGLVICKKLIEAMNGDIKVSSTEGVGSCFWIEIPLA